MCAKKFKVHSLSPKVYIPQTKIKKKKGKGKEKKLKIKCHVSWFDSVRIQPFTKLVCSVCKTQRLEMWVKETKSWNQAKQRHSL